MRTVLLAAVSILALTASVPSFAAVSEDATFDTNSKPVYDSNGHCVRTKWQGANDACGAKKAPEAPKKFVPVAIPSPALPEVSLEERTVYFDFNSATLTAESKSKLDTLADIINGASSVADVRIHGFTDQFGSTGYNTALANKRAKAVKAYLDGKSRLRSTVGDVKGLGKASPTDGCANVKDRAEKISCMHAERRVEIELKATK